MKKQTFVQFTVVFCVFFFLYANGFSGTRNVPFFTEQEQQQLAYDSDEWRKELEEHKEALAYHAKCGLCPIVSVVIPEAVENIYQAEIPLNLLVYLKGTFAAVDLETLIVKAKKGFFTLDITERIKPFIRKPKQDEDAEWVVDANFPEIPTGNYKISMSIKDTDGRAKEITALLKVNDE